MPTKMLEAAISKAMTLTDAAQEQIGRELLARIEALDALRADLQVGVDQLDAGLGEPLDLESLLEDARREHGEG